MKIGNWLAAGVMVWAGLAARQAAGQSKTAMAVSHLDANAKTEGATQPGNLAGTLAKLDAASAKFRSGQADFHKVLFNALVKDETTQDGKVYVVRTGGSPQLGIVTTGAGARTVEYKDGKLRAYNPGIKCYDTVNPGSQSKVDTFLTLGFGGSGRDLAKAWEVSDLGPDSVGDGRTGEKLVLVPKDAGVRGSVTRVTLWMNLENGIALKQVLETPSKDTQTAVYTNLRVKVDMGTFEIPKKAGACGK